MICALDLHAPVQGKSSNPSCSMRILVIEKIVSLGGAMAQALVGDGHEVVGPYSTVASAKPSIEAGGFDLAALDLDLPGHESSSLLEFATRQIAPEKILLTSSSISAATLVKAGKCQAAGFFDKGSEPISAFCEAVKLIGTGARYHSSSYVTAQATLAHKIKECARKLTWRQVRMLSLYGLGASNEEIGAQLGIAANTVRWHRTRLMFKLGIFTPAHLVLFALQYGFSTLPELTSSNLQDLPVNFF